MRCRGSWKRCPSELEGHLPTVRGKLLIDEPLAPFTWFRVGGPADVVFLPADEPVCTYPVVVANILASALDALADTLAARVAPGGRLAMSGILHGQEEELLQRYAPWFTELRATRMEDWMRIDGVRRTEAAPA